MPPAFAARLRPAVLPDELVLRDDELRAVLPLRALLLPLRAEDLRADELRDDELRDDDPLLRDEEAREPPEELRDDDLRDEPPLDDDLRDEPPERDDPPPPLLLELRFDSAMCLVPPPRLGKARDYATLKRASTGA